MPVLRAVYPKSYPIELTEEQKVVLREILADLKDVQDRHRPPKHVPDICQTCGKDKNPPPFLTYMDTWILHDYQRLEGQIEMVEALLGTRPFVGDHT